MSTKEAKLKKSVELRPHQEEAVQFALDNNGRGLFAHGTGSGKTLSAIATFEKLKADGKATKALVITPASLQENFEQSGVKRFTNSSVNRGTDGKSDYQIMSMAKFRRDPQQALKDSKADTVIVDEIHRAKDKMSVTNRALREVSPQVKNFLGLTGSFISNHPKEVIPLLDVISPGHDLGSMQGFQKRYTKTKQIPGGFLKGPKRRTDLQRHPELGGKLRGKLHYLGHEDIAKDMPRMDVENVHVQMSPEQTKLYNFALGKLTPMQRRKIRDGLPASQTEAMHILSAIMKARQASNSIGSHKDMPLSQAAEDTPKIKRVLDDIEKHLSKNKDGQAVVYTNFVHGGADVLVEGLKARGHKPGLFAGVGALGVTKDSRHKDVKDFKDGKKKVIILTPAASEGVSLDNATGFFEVDRHYNPERNQQAIARGRRLGGQAHRKQKDRVLEVKRYYSDPKPGLLNRLLGQKEVGVDEWVGMVANEKQRLNDELRKTVKTASPGGALLPGEDMAAYIARRNRQADENLRKFDPTDLVGKVRQWARENPYKTMALVLGTGAGVGALGSYLFGQEKEAEVLPSHVDKKIPVHDNLQDLLKKMKPGDVFATKTNSQAKGVKSQVSRFIGKVTGNPWTHVGMYTGNGQAVHAYEDIKDGQFAWDAKVREQSLKDVVGMGRDILVLRPDLSGKQKQDALKRMDDLKGTPYSYVGLVSGMLPDRDAVGDERSKKPGDAICTTAVGWAHKDLDFGNKSLNSLKVGDFMKHKKLKQVAALSGDKTASVYVQEFLKSADIFLKAKGLEDSQKEKEPAFLRGAVIGGAIGGGAPHALEAGTNLVHSVDEAISEMGGPEGRAARLSTALEEHAPKDVTFIVGDTPKARKSAWFADIPAGAGVAEDSTGKIVAQGPGRFIQRGYNVGSTAHEIGHALGGRPQNSYVNTLIDEGGASLRGLKLIQKTHGTLEALKAVPGLGAAFLNYAAKVPTSARVALGLGGATIGGYLAHKGEEKSASLYAQEFLKLAIQSANEKESVEMEDPKFEAIRESVIRMPGPQRRTRAFQNMTTAPTENSKPHAQFEATSRVGESVRPLKTEGVN